MADETVINGVSLDDRTVQISGDDASAKISGLTAKVTDLEQENSKTIQENEDYKRQIENLKSSIKELNTEIVELKAEVGKGESENKVLGVVAARASELEADVSRLQHDLVSTMSDLQESTHELSSLKKDFEVVKEKEKETDVKLDAIIKERDLLLAKVEKLEGVESELKLELEGKEKEIRGLKKTIEVLEVAVESLKGLGKSKNELEEEFNRLKVEIRTLESSLKEKEIVIREFETGEVANGCPSGKDEIKIVKQIDWTIVGGSAVAAAAFMGLVCYIHARRY